MERAADTEVMKLALNEARTVITADLDYPRLLALTGASGPSLIVFRGGDWSETATISRLAQVLASLDELDIRQSILTVERHRVRR